MAKYLCEKCETIIEWPDNFDPLTNCGTCLKSLTVLDSNTSSDSFWEETIIYGLDKTCKICDGTLNHSHLAESPQTREIATELADALNEAKAWKDVLGKKKGYMLGVLALGEGSKVAKKIYVAASGSWGKPIPNFKETVKSWCLKNDLEVKIILFPPDQPVTLGGAHIDKLWVRQIDERSPARPFECAAPKLINAVQGFFGGDLSMFMTEMWCGPGDGYHEHGTPYPSCGNCQDILPMMLCQKEPIPIKDKEGFILRKEDRKDARAGRKKKESKPPQIKEKKVVLSSKNPFALLMDDNN